MLAEAGQRAIGALVGDDGRHGWAAADELARDHQALGAALAKAGRDLGTDRLDIQGARLVEVWSWHVAAPAASTVLLSGRLPDLRAANTLLWLGEDPPAWPIALRAPGFHAVPGDPDAGHPDARLAAGEDELVRLLHRMLADTHLEPLVESVNALTRRPRTALWRSAADRLAGAFLWAGDALRRQEHARDLARRVLSIEPPLTGRARTQPVGGAAEHLHVRDGCCLYYRLPGAPKCLSCPLVDDAERERRWAAERAA